MNLIGRSRSSGLITTSFEPSRSSMTPARFSSFTKVLHQMSGMQTSFAPSETVSNSQPQSNLQPPGDPRRSPGRLFHYLCISCGLFRLVSLDTHRTYSWYRRNDTPLSVHLSSPLSQTAGNFVVAAASETKTVICEGQSSPADHRHAQGSERWLFVNS